nr:hypothetical protein [Pseudoxanthomonas sp.]
MNTRDKNPPMPGTPLEPPFDAREWEQQERGRHAARQAGDADPETAVRDYRLVARAVRSRPHGEPPADFATAVAGLVAEREPGIERGLSRWLSAALVIVLGIVSLRYGASVWAAFQQALGDAAAGWALLGLGCAGLSWVGARVQAFALQARPRRSIA